MSIGPTNPILLAGEANSIIAAMNQAIPAMEEEIQEKSREIRRYCTGHEDTIRSINTTLTSGNRHYFSPAQIEKLEIQLEQEQKDLEATRAPLNARIDVLRANILAIQNRTTTIRAEIATGTMQGLRAVPAIDNMPIDLLPLITSFLP